MSARSHVDEIDRAILNCLQQDARMPCTQIAGQIGYITPRAIRNRLQSLLERGYIAIEAGAIPERLGYVISADISVEAQPGTIRQVADSLCDLDQVIYVALSTGDTDISASIVATDMDDLQTYITEKVHSIPGVRKTRTIVLTRVLKQSYDWPFPEELTGL
jgi:Lrp/AsnC family transcriptional regulator for asnA, asnC and gidA